MAVAIAGEEQIPAEWAIRDWAGRQAQINLIDLILGERLDRFWREREPFGVSEGELAAQPGDVGASRREANRWQRGSAAGGTERQRGSYRDDDRPARESRRHDLPRPLLDPLRR